MMRLDSTGTLAPELQGWLLGLPGLAEESRIPGSILWLTPCTQAWNLWHIQWSVYQRKVTL